MRSLLFNRIVFAAFGFSFAFYGYADETKNPTIQLQNYYKENHNITPRCLSVINNSINVLLGDCTGKDKSATQFTLQKSVGEYYTLRPANNAALCLRSYAGSQQIKLAKCSEDVNTPANYASMRDWKLINDSGLYNIENRYKDDVGSVYRCLSVFSATDNVALGECAIAGGEKEFNQMRLWRMVY